MAFPSPEAASGRERRCCSRTRLRAPAWWPSPSKTPAPEPLAVLKHSGSPTSHSGAAKYRGCNKSDEGDSFVEILPHSRSLHDLQLPRPESLGLPCLLSFLPAVIRWYDCKPTGETKVFPFIRADKISRTFGLAQVW